MLAYLRREYVPHWQLIALVLPGLLAFVLFNYVPMVGLIIAFKRFSMSVGILHSPWAGLENFERLFSSDDFPRTVRNTLTLSLLRLAFGFAAPVVLALMLNEVRLQWFRRSVQTVAALPYFFSWAVLGGILVMILNGDGPVNTLIRAAGHSPISFLGDETWFVVMLVASGIWQSAGYGAIIYIAALAGIDPGLYEAAAIDGAGRWKQTLHVTLPGLLPTIIVLLILSMGDILNAGFDQVYNLYNPLVYGSADIVDTYVLRRLFDMDYSLATAAGMFKSVVGLLLIVAANWLARRVSRGEQGLW